MFNNEIFRFDGFALGERWIRERPAHKPQSAVRTQNSCYFTISWQGKCDNCSRRANISPRPCFWLAPVIFFSRIILVSQGADVCHSAKPRALFFFVIFTPNITPKWLWNAVSILCSSLINLRLNLTPFYNRVMWRVQRGTVQFKLLTLVFFVLRGNTRSSNETGWLKEIAMGWNHCFI